MMMNTTLEQLRSSEARLAWPAACRSNSTQAGMTGISFEERLALLVDREVHWRNDKRQARLLEAGAAEVPARPAIEDIDTRAGRGSGSRVR